MSEALPLAVDQGTSSTKCLAVDERARVVARSIAGLGQYAPAGVGRARCRRNLDERSTGRCSGARAVGGQWRIYVGRIGAVRSRGGAVCAGGESGRAS